MRGLSGTAILLTVKYALAAVSVVALAGAAGFVGWSVLGRSSDGYITGEAAESFNLKTGPAPARESPRPFSGETLRDAVAAAPPAPSSLTRPIAFNEMNVSGVKPAPASAAPKAYTVITPKAEAWAMKHKFLSAIAARPARYLIEHSALGTARGLRAFLADKKKVDAYMNSTLVRVALNSPAVAKSLLGNPVLVRAFLGTPAMRDPQTVRALLGSPMLHKMLDCPAIQEAIGDPAVVQKMLLDPQTVRWLGSNPQVLTALSDASPALAAAFSGRSRGAAASFGR